MEYSFEKLRVWQEAKGLVVLLYKITNDFPKSELYGLSSQLRRAGLSVPSNIAEGSGRTGRKDQSRFYTIAYSSLIEVLNQLIIAEELGFLSEEDLKELRKRIEYISNMLNALKTSVNN
jgi:four helix bundle protein